jgi:hypothetical protein
MDTRPLVYKRISNDDTVFFVFKINNKLILYDSGMGYVIQKGYGAENTIFNILSKEISRAKNKERKQFKVFWLVVDGDEGWKITTSTRAGYSNDKDGKVDGLARPEKNNPNIKFNFMTMTVHASMLTIQLLGIFIFAIFTLDLVLGHK